jgi:serine/threonine-protein kinase PknK
MDPPMVGQTSRDPTIDIASELEAAGFERVTLIGRGGFGVVYRCAQPALDRTVAVKVLTTEVDQENLARFLREQRVMGKLSGHPNIVGILFSGVLPGQRPYLVMPYHPSKSLQERLERDGPLPWRDAVRIGVKVAGALEAAHRRGVLHRDVKPGNILVSDYGEPELTDFGIAHVAGGFVTTAGIVTGSPAFTAPEVLKGDAPTSVSDVYSLGATLFCLITGHAAFERRHGERVVSQFLRITSEPVPDLRSRDFPDDVCGAIERAMASNPDDRYASAAAFGAELCEIQQRHGLPVDRMVLPADAETEGTAGYAPIATQELPSTERYSAPRSRPSAAVRTPPTAATKFRPPTPARPLVVRERLLDSLRAGQRRRLIVIHGPAGFGKSTLAAQWRDILAAQGARVAWLSIDRDDNNVVWFLAHLIEALRPALPALAAELRELLELYGDDAEPYVSATLIDRIHSGGEQVALIIDDWHRVTDAATIAALGGLLDRGCHHLQVIVTSRSRTGLPMSKLRVADELVEIDSKALRFNVSEAQSFFAGAGGADLAVADIGRLAAATDGWVAALQLASLSLRGCDDPSELIDHLSGRHQSIADFLAENVLDGLEPRLLEFLLRTSIAERLCGGLAAALSGMSSDTALLEEVEAKDLFLTRIDAEGRWFRYHHLFAEFLRRRLERDHPDWIPDLHRRASRWFADHHLVREAVDHALAVDDEARAVKLVETDGVRLLEQSQMSTLVALIAKLPAATVASSVRLQLTTAWASLLLQHRAPANAALAQVRSLLERDEHARIEAVQIEAAVVDAAVRATADRIDGVEELVSGALARPEQLHPWVVTAAADIAAFAAIYRFDFAAVHRWQQWAADYQRRTGGPFTVMYGYCFDGIAANEELDIAMAETDFRTAVRAAMRNGGGRMHAVRIASALLGDLLFDKGDIDAAEQLLDEGYELGREGGSVDSMLATFGTGARIKALRGELDAARQRLHDGWRAATTLSLPRLAARMVNESIRIGIPLPAEDNSIHLTAADPATADNGIEIVTAELAEESAIRELLERRTVPAAVEAGVRARARVDRIAGQHRPRALLQANLLLTTCLAEAGATEEAARILLPVARQCADQSLVGLLRYSGPAVLAILRDIASGEDAGSGSALPEAFVAAVVSQR